MGIKINIRIMGDIADVKDVFEANVDMINDKMQKDALRFCRYVKDKQVKPHTPVGETGKLRKSIDVKMDRRNKYSVVIRMYAGENHPVPYALYIEEGTKDHKPLIFTYMKFTATQGDYKGYEIFTKRVKGIGAYGMFEKGYVTIKTWLPKVLQEGLKSLPFRVPRYRV